ncbi:MAG: hypothetical protein FJX31_08140 [Alphaproteobacteria bacterium]|nr:hypothetical protein [Alphaproteobacteria bacterium]
MISSKTTLVVGAGASCELQFPGNEELLSRVGQSFNFARFGTGVQVKDSVLPAQYLQKMALASPSARTRSPLPPNAAALPPS